MAKGTALFITCLVDEFFPEVGEASVSCLAAVGCRPEFSSGADVLRATPPSTWVIGKRPRRLARRFIEIFEPYEVIVAPAGSCTAMVRVFYPELFESEPDWRKRAEELSSRVCELTEFLSKKGFRSEGAHGLGKVTYHDSCHLLRELGVHQQPRELLQQAQGLELVELEGANVCCGFGGAFSVKMPELSEAIPERQTSRVGGERRGRFDCDRLRLSDAPRRRPEATKESAACGACGSRLGRASPRTSNPCD